MTINEKLSKIQVEFKSKKSRFNSFGKYNFRSAEDILEATKPLTMKPGSCDQPVLQCTATLYDGTDAISATAIVGVDTEQKGMQMPQRYGAASSYGKKYALGNLFLIDDTQDADATNQHGKKTAAKQTMTNESLAKAKEYISKGGSLDAIKAKYVVTKKHEEMLTL